MRELTEEAGGEETPGTLRRFLNWEEAQEMSGGGMAIGSHTHSHTVLSQLEPEQQRQELAKSKDIIMKKLGIEAKVLAYPVGHKTSFSNQTWRIAQELGYRCAFSHYGGVNLQAETSPYDVKRTKVVYQSQYRFRVQTAVCQFTGRFWP
jgi:peptidoglycan/xylan/chitin deacetylase (PgdA/CDA1 family)